ncbi:hypothetical protein VTJ49DRAFT_1121 [Mycothermus thermophilus]|uniref:Protein kinase domain-containing protein n=1 Tax=Humicola insolens TaxID=85995 RepID=A0ABR3VQU4_HUMIN
MNCDQATMTQEKPSVALPLPLPVPVTASKNEDLLRSAEDVIFIRPLSSGATCTTDLVYCPKVGRVCVRKTLLHGESRRRDAVDFDRDVRTAYRLATVAASGETSLRIPELLAAQSCSGSPRVSLWSLCNGGTLGVFLREAEWNNTAVPEGLALHFLLQVLETLDFMYTATETPMYHTDLHTANLMLHFTGSSGAPDVYVIDFGRTAHADPQPGDFLFLRSGKAPGLDTDMCSEPNPADHVLPFWDMDEVLNLTKRLMLATFPCEGGKLMKDVGAYLEEGRRRSLDDHRSQRKHQRHRRHVKNAKDKETSSTGPCPRLRAAFDALEGLHNLYKKRWMAASKERMSRYKAGKSLLPPPTPPSLKRTIELLQTVTPPLLKKALEGKEYGMFRRMVLEKARRKAESMEEARPGDFGDFGEEGEEEEEDGEEGGVAIW